MNEKELRTLITQHNKLARKINLAIKKRDCIDRIVGDSYRKHITQDQEDIADIYRNQFEYLINYISKTEDDLLDIDIKINGIQLRLYGVCVI